MNWRSSFRELVVDRDKVGRSLDFRVYIFFVRMESGFLREVFFNICYGAIYEETMVVFLVF